MGKCLNVLNVKNNFRKHSETQKIRGHKGKRNFGLEYIVANCAIHFQKIKTFYKHNWLMKLVMDFELIWSCYRTTTEQKKNNINAKHI